MKTFGNQAGLVSIKRTIDFRFILKTHLQPIKFIVGLGGIKDHVSIAQKSIELSIHSLSPLWAFGSQGKTCGLHPKAKIQT